MLKKLTIFLLVAVLVTACEKKKLAPVERPLVVTIGEVTTRDVPVFINTFGHAVSPISVDLTAQVTGIIKESYVREGQNVKKGDLLYLIDPEPYQYALEKVKANLIQTEANLEYSKEKLQRYSELIKKDFVSKLVIKEYEKDIKVNEALVLSSKADVGMAEKNLNYSSINSPIDGRVGLVKINVGNLVVKDDKNMIVQIQQISPIDIEFAIPQKEFQKLQPFLNYGSNKFNVSLINEKPTEFSGEIIAFDNTLSLSTGTIKIKGRVDNHEAILWPGEFVKIELFLTIKEHALVIPYSAIQFGEKGPFVYVLKDDLTVEPVTIKVSEKIDDLIVVDEGLMLGMKVVTDGQLNLLPGSKVVIVQTETLL